MGFRTVSFIPRKKVLIPRHSKVCGIVKLKLGMERNYVKKLPLQKNPAPANRIESIFPPQNASERNS
jgi:hypothetical protein